MSTPGNENNHLVIPSIIVPSQDDPEDLPVAVDQYEDTHINPSGASSPVFYARSTTPDSSAAPATPPSNSPTLSPLSALGLSHMHSGTYGGSRRPSDAGLLAPSPILKSRGSLEVRSPSPSPSNDGTSQYSIPPSPTISHASVHFETSVALRNNKPDETSGESSLDMLKRHPARLTLGDERGHGRKASFNSISSARSVDETTEPDHPMTPLMLSPDGYGRHRSRSVSQERSDDGGSMTVVASPTIGEHSDNSTFAKDNEHAQSSGAHETQESKKHGEDDVNWAEADDSMDTSPFDKRVSPSRIASLVDPKNMELLTELGGIRGLTLALGSHMTKGLGAGSPNDPGSVDSNEWRNQDSATGQRHDRPDDLGGPSNSLPVPEMKIIISPPDNEIQEPPEYREHSRPSSPAHSDHSSKHSHHDEDKATPVKDDVDYEKSYSSTMEDRQRVYGVNFIPVRQSKSLLQLMWLALKDKVLVLLSIAAVVSLALGLFQDFGTERPTFSCGNGQTCEQPPVDWVEGVAIMVAIVIVVAVGSVNDWQKEIQFKKLNEKKEDRTVKVIRNGREKVINTKDVVVGDVALLEPGEVIPCDGIFLTGHNVKCDESGATGESDTIKKASYDECLRLQSGTHTDCFIISGSKVLEGVGSYIVIAVGPRSFNGRIMLALRGDTENTPLQIKLNALAELIAKLGSAAGLLLFSALLIRFFVELGTNNPERSANQKGLAFVQILIISVTLIVVAVPEGLPLAVTLALAFATKRMTAENLLVRVLGSCESMANASVVCTDKTGTLTQNAMTVVAGSIGIHAKFVHKLDQNQERTNAGDQEGVSQDAADTSTEVKVRRHPEDFSLEMCDLNKVLRPQLQRLTNEAIAVNSTAFEDEDAESGKRVFIGSKTETALLSFAKGMGWEDYDSLRHKAHVVQMIPFSSERKAMGVVVEIGPGQGWRLYLKGASEILTKKCTRHVVVTNMLEDSEAATSDEEVETKEIGEQERDNISRTIIFYANQTLRTIALCYRDLPRWPLEPNMNADEVPYEELARDLTLIGITGIEDPLRDGVRQAVADCHKAGVTVKMCTGDNVLTARSIALQCGIFTPGGIIMEGPVFRQLNDRDMLEVVPRLQVLARSSPEDKQILVEKLKSIGEIVGVTGDGTNDGPALKTAHVGFSMGIAGTEVAKEASDIILMDDNFSSIVKAIMWGRCVNDAVRKFLQFQVSVNITAVVVTFVSAVASAQGESVLSAVQLLWVNIIMDTFAALALATDPASPALLDRKPARKNAPLFSVDMYKQIIGQAIYQIIFTLVFHFAGNAIFGYHPDPTNESVQIHNTDVLNTMVFNAFVFANIFNSINCRRIDNKLNVFEGIQRNYYFIGITLIEIGAQILIVFVGGQAFQVTKIEGREWGISLALGVMSLPIGAVIRCVPNPPIEKLFIKLHILSDPNALPTTRPDTDEGGWNPAINLVRDNLNTFSSLRGGRLRSSSFVGKSRTARLQESFGLPSIMTMVPTLVASSIGAGWAPQSGSLSDPGNTDPSRSSAALWEGKVQLHPDTAKDDPAFIKWGGSQSDGNV